MKFDSLSSLKRNETYEILGVLITEVTRVDILSVFFSLLCEKVTSKRRGVTQVDSEMHSVRCQYSK